MRKIISITETSTITHDIIVDCLTKEAEENLENILDSGINSCTDIYEIEDALDKNDINIVSCHKEQLKEDCEFSYYVGDF